MPFSLAEIARQRRSITIIPLFAHSLQDHSSAKSCWVYQALKPVPKALSQNPSPLHPFAVHLCLLTTPAHYTWHRLGNATVYGFFFGFVRCLGFTSTSPCVSRHSWRMTSPHVIHCLCCRTESAWRGRTARMALKRSMTCAHVVVSARAGGARQNQKLHPPPGTMR